MNSPKVVIRAARRDDAISIHEIHTRSVTALCADVYSTEIIDTWLKNRTAEGYYKAIDRGCMYVALADDAVVGFVNVVPGEIWALFVDAPYAGRGVGAQMLEYALSVARREHAGPVKVVSTLNAVPFYTRHGFRLVQYSAEPRGDIEIPVAEMEL